MLNRTISILLAVVLFFTPLAAIAADRGPSTPEERTKALEYIHDWQANPLGPNAKIEFGWVLKWIADIPDITVHACTIFDKMPSGNKKDSSTVYGGMFMAQTAFLIDNPDKKDDRLAEFQAGAEGGLQVYETLLRLNPKDRQSDLDELIQRRQAGALADFVKERSASCMK